MHVYVNINFLRYDDHSVGVIIITANKALLFSFPVGGRVDTDL